MTTPLSRTDCLQDLDVLGNADLTLKSLLIAHEPTRRRRWTHAESHFWACHTFHFTPCHLYRSLASDDLAKKNGKGISMQIERLDHVNLRTTQLNQMVQWYEDILGLTAGARPDFPFPGAWLYAGPHALVHLIGIDGPDGTGSEVELKLEHFAFRATDAADFEARLDAATVCYRKVVIEETETVAFNVWDPDGNHIHVDFTQGA